MSQLETLTPSALLLRLINGHRHLLALRVATLLNLGPEKVDMHLSSILSTLVEQNWLEMNVRSDTADNTARGNFDMPPRMDGWCMLPGLSHLTNHMHMCRCWCTGRVPSCQPLPTLQTLLYETCSQTSSRASAVLAIQPSQSTRRRWGGRGWPPCCWSSRPMQQSRYYSCNVAS